MVATIAIGAIGTVDDDEGNDEDEFDENDS